MKGYISPYTYIELEICDNDGECAKVCPVDAIVIKTTTLVWENGGSAPIGKDLYVRPDVCIDCGLCVDSCPNGAIFSDAGGGGTGVVDNDSGGNYSSIVVLGPRIRINNINDFLKCLNLNSPATLTIYSEQPVPNSADAYTFTFNGPEVGHSFISIKQGEHIKVIGFYPATSVLPNQPSTNGAYGNDESYNYNVSHTININPQQLSNIVSYITQKEGARYDLNTYNCTDFAIDIGNLAGLNIPDCYGSWFPYGGGSNPGALGQYLRGISNSNQSSNSRAPRSTNCP